MSTTVLVKQATRGQVTVPVKFRSALGIKKETVYRAELKGFSIVLTPITGKAGALPLREFSTRDIAQFLAADKLDKRAARRAQALLAKL